MKNAFVTVGAVVLLSLTSFSAHSDVTMSYGEDDRIDAWCNQVQIHQKGVGEIKFVSGKSEDDSKLEIVKKDEGVDVDVVYKKNIHTLTIKKNKRVLIVVKFTKSEIGSSVSVVSKGNGSVSVTCN